MMWARVRDKRLVDPFSIQVHVIISKSLVLGEC